jgi:hypothetical protein
MAATSAVIVTETAKVTPAENVEATFKDSLREYATQTIDVKSNKWVDIDIQWTEDNIVYINKAGTKTKGPKCDKETLKRVLWELLDDHTWTIHNKWRPGYPLEREGNVFHVVFDVPFVPVDECDEPW